jgi:hypothetical protein
MAAITFTYALPMFYPFPVLRSVGPRPGRSKIAYDSADLFPKQLLATLVGREIRMDTFMPLVRPQMKQQILNFV